MFRPNASPPAWPSRWGRLARAAGISPDERLLVALSGGADSVLLLHLVAAASPRPAVRAVYVDHGLRGEEGREDGRFCANLCRALGVPFGLRTLDLSAEEGSLEASARRERYRVLFDEALRSDHRTVLTGHHSDDALETLLLRWTRGTAVEGLTGPRPSFDVSVPGREPGSSAHLRVVRPLLPLRREEVRRLLTDRGLTWREDATNRDPRHARNRLRHGFLPALADVCGEEGLDNLRAFGLAVERLEERLAAETAHLTWDSPFYASASRGEAEHGLGGVIDRAELMALPMALRRRALWRLLTEGTGRAPGRGLEAHLLADLGAGRCTRHTLPGGWVLLLRADQLHLLPPNAAAPSTPRRAKVHQAWLPFPGGPGGAERPADLAAGARFSLSVPGIVSLGDGRRLSAEILESEPGAPVRGSGLEVELDADGLDAPLLVRFASPGDRFRGLGAPGSKPLSRFLADRGVPREERPGIPLVVGGGEIVWAAGIEVADARRVRPATRARLRLTLHPGRPARVRSTGSGARTALSGA